MENGALGGRCTRSAYGVVGRKRRGQSESGTLRCALELARSVGSEVGEEIAIFIGCERLSDHVVGCERLREPSRTELIQV